MVDGINNIFAIRKPDQTTLDTQMRLVTSGHLTLLWSILSVPERPSCFVTKRLDDTPVSFLISSSKRLLWQMCDAPAPSSSPFISRAEVRWQGCLIKGSRMDFKATRGTWPQSYYNTLQRNTLELVYKCSQPERSLSTYDASNYQSSPIRPQPVPVCLTRGPKRLPICVNLISRIVSMIGRCYFCVWTWQNPQVLARLQNGSIEQQPSIPFSRIVAHCPYAWLDAFTHKHDHKVFTQQQCYG